VEIPPIIPPSAVSHEIRSPERGLPNSLRSKVTGTRSVSVCPAKIAAPVTRIRAQPWMVSEVVARKFPLTRIGQERVAVETVITLRMTHSPEVVSQVAVPPVGSLQTVGLVQVYLGHVLTRSPLASKLGSALTPPFVLPF